MLIKSALRLKPGGEEKKTEVYYFRKPLEMGIQTNRTLTERKQ